MSLKAEIETWAAALQAYDSDDLEGALDKFEAISDTSKILTNIGLIHATLGEHEIAVEKFRQAVEHDQYLAIAYFQCGVSNFLLGRYELALKDFEDALLYLRGNQTIDYEQLGLKFKLYSAEVLFNKGLSLIYTGLVDQGLAELQDARLEKATAEHAVIDEAIQDRGDGYTVFSIPVGVLYRPSETKLKNAKTKDYLGKAKLVSASDSKDAFTTFTGVTRLKQGLTPSAATYLDSLPPTNYNELGASGASLNRSVTAPAPRNAVDPIDGPVRRGGSPANAALARSKTTLNVPSDARDRIAGLSGATAPLATPGRSASPSLARSATSAGAAASSSSAMRGGPGSMRQSPRAAANASPVPPASSSPPPPAADAPGARPSPSRKGSAARLTEIYEDYLGGYGDEDAEPVPPLPTNVGGGNGRIAAWAEKNAQPPARSQSARAPPPPSTYAPSSYGGGRRRNGGTMRRTKSSARSVVAPSSYEDEEEGYGSGEDYDYELVKVRVKLHYQDDIRGMAVSPEMPFDEFVEAVRAKFEGARVSLKFKEEDGHKVSLRDESDWEMAIETAREAAKGRAEGKLEIWCADN